MDDLTQMFLFGMALGISIGAMIVNIIWYIISMKNL